MTCTAFCGKQVVISIVDMFLTNYYEPSLEDLSQTTMFDCWCFMSNGFKTVNFNIDGLHSATKCVMVQLFVEFVINYWMTLSQSYLCTDMI